MGDIYQCKHFFKCHTAGRGSSILSDFEVDMGKSPLLAIAYFRDTFKLYVVLQNVLMDSVSDTKFWHHIFCIRFFFISLIGLNQMVEETTTTDL